jgi:hypothetical protein
MKIQFLIEFFSILPVEDLSSIAQLEISHHSLDVFWKMLSNLVYLFFPLGDVSDLCLVAVYHTPLTPMLHPAMGQVERG